MLEPQRRPLERLAFYALGAENGVTFVEKEPVRHDQDTDPHGGADVAENDSKNNRLNEARALILSGYAAQHTLGSGALRAGRHLFWTERTVRSPVASLWMHR